MVAYPRLSRFVGRGSCVSARTIRIVLHIAFCLSFVFLVFPTPADEAADLAFIRKANPISTLKPQEAVRFNLQETSELKLTAAGLIRLYQKFISSQDGPACNFVPSCSRFGMGCIQEYGMLRGLLLTSDRLLRCNGTGSTHHYKDETTGKYIDPVLDYAAW
ncbi:MAG: membrane protein insertion efficiency factor YidD [Candidatus Poribacteria bacterium]|nr:membrane protein insertion efficiency factor YidD [Candidatus Poribacteria bacterium]